MKLSSSGTLVDEGGFGADVCCENIQKLSSGEFLAIGWTRARKGWVYKIPSDNVPLWTMTLEIDTDNVVLAANYITTGEIALAVYSRDKLFWTIIMDSRGNVRNEVYSSVVANSIYAGVVGTSGMMALIGRDTEALATIKSLCPANTYQPYSSETCVTCLQGQYQNLLGQYSCKPCIGSCLSCTTGTNCLKCASGYFVSKVSSTVSECVTDCPSNYINDETTGQCESKLCLRGSVFGRVRELQQCEEVRRVQQRSGLEIQRGRRHCHLRLRLRPLLLLG